MAETLRVDVDNGKYTVIQDENGVRIDRQGVPWCRAREAGDNFVLAMAYELEELRAKVVEQQKPSTEPQPTLYSLMTHSWVFSCNKHDLGDADDYVLEQLERMDRREFLEHISEYLEHRLEHYREKLNG